MQFRIWSLNDCCCCCCTKNEEESVDEVPEPEPEPEPQQPHSFQEEWTTDEDSNSTAAEMEVKQIIAEPIYTVKKIEENKVSQCIFTMTPIS